MPATIVLVYDEPRVAADIAIALRAKNYDIAVFNDPLAAMVALDTPDKIRVLITSIHFPEGRSNGLAMARMTRLKGRNVHAILIDAPETQHFATEISGTFLPTPVNMERLLAAVKDALQPPEEAQ